ncbi:hypothetical protein AQUCO_01400411v1 [Aquilegia coerulea]|uniref:Probable purine permease n=1 Tax=Aquilegia coerulea TaxID=218851 RepID=A0A2G5DX12_AQUCA|nr:hypothetical protein AQUCO_01400411v1 [Aquilegia coerulea]
MEKVEELQIPIQDSQEPNSANATTYDESATSKPPLPRDRDYKWWLLVSFYSVLVLVGQTGATLLGKFYFDNGGNSEWLATLVQSGGFPVLIPFFLFFSSPTTSTSDLSNNTKRISLSFTKLAMIYSFFGLVACIDNLMYSFGYKYLPVSIFSLISATQLAFNALFSYFLNSLKFTHLILNSLVLLTISALVLGIQGGEDSHGPSNIPPGKYIVGFLCTLGASALYSLLLSLNQVYFEKIRKEETILVVLEMTIFITMVATSVSVVGLFVSGQWKELKGEMELFKTGRVSYVMTLGWTAVLWQVYAVSSTGLIHEASSLFSNVISTVWLPVVPILAAILFHDKMTGMKVVAMLLSVWGFVSYVYGHYLDYLKSKTPRTNANNISAA